MDQGFKRYEPKGLFWKWPHDTSFMSYNEKSWLKGYTLMLHRWKLAEVGGNWLKLAKTKWLGIKKLRKTNNFRHFYFIDSSNCSKHLSCLSLHSSVVSVLAFKSKGPGFKPPLSHDFFLFINGIWGSWVQTPLEFTSIFPSWYSNIIPIYDFFTLL